MGYEFKKTKSKKGRERERGVLYCYNLIHTRQRSLKTSKANTEKFVMPGYITFESKKVEIILNKLNRKKKEFQNSQTF